MVVSHEPSIADPTIALLRQPVSEALSADWRSGPVRLPERSSITTLLQVCCQHLL